jgi:hypothetical protein
MQCFTRVAPKPRCGDAVAATAARPAGVGHRDGRPRPHSPTGASKS